MFSRITEPEFSTSHKIRDHSELGIRKTWWAVTSLVWIRPGSLVSSSYDDESGWRFQVLHLSISHGTNKLYQYDMNLIDLLFYYKSGA